MVMDGGTPVWLPRLMVWLRLIYFRLFENSPANLFVSILFDVKLIPPWMGNTCLVAKVDGMAYIDLH